MSLSRPNLVMFMPDQLRANALGCFGNPIAQTPNIDALAARGTRFVNAFANHPVCGPSRVNLMTGWYPHTAGHRTLTHLLKPWDPNLLRYLKDAGYNVAWAGHRGDTFAPGVTEQSTDFRGFSTRPERLFGPPRYPEGSPLYDAFYNGRREHEGVVLDFDEAAVRTAEDWLADAPREPWLLFVALIFPHLPFEVEDPWYAMFSPGDMPEPIAPEACRGKPSYHRALREKMGLARLSPGDWAEIARTYYGMIARVDAQLGRILRSVEAAGCAQRTATFFFTDHGEYLGDYGLVEKWPSGLEDCLVHNPVIAQIPGGREGQVAQGFVEMVDFLPTLLELADSEAKHTHFGRSFASALRGEGTPTRDAAYSEGGFRSADRDLFESVIAGPYANKTDLQREQPRTVGKAVARRDGAFTYIYRLYESDELYDRRADPGETHNRIDDPEFAQDAARLREAVLAWLLESSDVIPWEKDPRFPQIAHGSGDPGPAGQGEGA